MLMFTSLNAQKKITNNVKKKQITSSKNNSILIKGFDRGDIFISFGIGLNSDNQNDVKVTTYKAKPQIGCFFSKNFALGLSTGYQYGIYENLTVTKRTIDFSMGGFGRYYFSPDKRYSFFLEAEVDYLSKASKTVPTPKGSKSVTKFGGIQTIFSPGINYFLSKHFALETTVSLIGYKTEKAENIPNSKSIDTFDLKLDLSDVKFGMLYKF